jgi:capsular exopolysaccharide synthesis family protein
MADRPVTDDPRAGTELGTDLRTILRVIRRRGLLVALCMVLGAAVALVAAASEQKKYTATATLYFQTVNFDEALFGSASPVLAPSSDPARQAANDLALARQEAVAQLTAKTLHLGVTTVTNAVNVSADTGSDLISVNATTIRPRLSAAIATTYARSFVSLRRAADQQDIAAAEKLVQTQIAALGPSRLSGPEGAALRARDDQLKILASLQTGDVQVVQNAATPSVPSSPQPKHDGLIGGGLGLLVGIALLLMLERLDQRIRDVDEFEELLGLPVLAIVPQNRSFGAGEPAAALPGGSTEVFYLVRAKLRYFNVDRQIRSVLVTSAAPRDGKTTISWHLGIAAGASGQGRVLLVEADLRHPTMVSERYLLPGPGLTEVLTGEVELEDAISTIDFAAGPHGAEGTVDVIPAGFAPPNPPALIESRRMSELLAAVTDTYELVIIDTPPTTVVSDAMPLVPQVDGVIVVGRLYQTPRDAARRLIQDLRALGAPLLGLVVNGAHGKDFGTYGYAYYDGRASRAQGREARAAAEGGAVLSPRLPVLDGPASRRRSSPLRLNPRDDAPNP